MGQTGGGPAPSLTTLRDYLNGVIGTPVDDEVLERALTHRSYAYENGGLPNNERLEFLGDAVLGLVITDGSSPAEPGSQRFITTPATVSPADRAA